MIPTVRRDEKLFKSRIPQSLFFALNLSWDEDKREPPPFSLATIQRTAPAASPKIERMKTACLQPQRLIIKASKNGKQTFPISPEKL